MSTILITLSIIYILSFLGCRHADRLAVKWGLIPPEYGVFELIWVIPIANTLSCLISYSMIIGDYETLKKILKTKI
jgi:hypothetical protein